MAAVDRTSCVFVGLEGETHERAREFLRCWLLRILQLDSIRVGASASNFNSPNGAHPLFSSFVVDDDDDLGKSEASPLR